MAYLQITGYQIEENGETLHDVALRSLARLFSEKERPKLLLLEKDPKQLKAAVINSVWQELTDLFRERRPEIARSIRNIKVAARGYRLFRIKHKQFLIRQKKKRSGLWIAKEELLPHVRAWDTALAVSEAFAFVEKNRRYANYIRLGEMAKVLTRLARPRPRKAHVFDDPSIDIIIEEELKRVLDYNWKRVKASKITAAQFDFYAEKLKERVWTGCSYSELFPELTKKEARKEHGAVMGYWNRLLREGNDTSKWYKGRNIEARRRELFLT